MESLQVKAQNLIFVCRWQNLSKFVLICLYLSGFVFYFIFLSLFIFKRVYFDQVHFVLM